MRQAIALLLAAVVIVLAADKPSQARDVPFTQEDRDRIIRLEEGLKSTNQRIDDLRADMNSFKAEMRADMNNFKAEIKADMKNMKAEITTLMLWGFGVLFGGMWLLMGFVLWNRRTAIAPVIRKTKEVDEHSELIVEALKEMAAKNPDVKEALKHKGLL